MALRLIHHNHSRHIKIAALEKCSSECEEATLSVRQLGAVKRTPEKSHFVVCNCLNLRIKKFADYDIKHVESRLVFQFLVIRKTCTGMG